MDDKTYRLLATEPEGLFRPKRVKILKNAVVGDREDFFWGEVDEPFEGRQVRNQFQNNWILLATRHFGFSLKELNQLPLDVYICGVTNLELQLTDKLRQEDVFIMAWALLLSPDDERTSLEEIYDSLLSVRGNVFNVNPVHK